MDFYVSEDHIQEFIDAKNEAVRRGLEAIGLQAEGYAKMKCPVDTGNLRNSISHAVSGDEAYIGTNVEYAAYVELGTTKMAARPYLRPAAAGHTAEYRAIMKSALEGQL